MPTQLAPSDIQILPSEYLHQIYKLCRSQLGYKELELLTHFFPVSKLSDAVPSTLSPESLAPHLEKVR